MRGDFDDATTLAEVAQHISAAVNRSIPVRSLSVEDATAGEVDPSVVQNLEWTNAEGYRVDRDGAASLALPPRSVPFIPPGRRPAPQS